MPVYFFEEDVAFSLKNPEKTARWIKAVARKEKRAVGTLNYIFCSDSFLLELNKKYLRHKTLTDIITFPFHEPGEPLTGDVFISVDRVRENAGQLGIDFETELRRVIVHGVLHLIGYRDKTVEEKKQMRKKEDAYLSLLPVSRST